MSEVPEQIRAFISLPLDTAVAREVSRLRRRLEAAMPPGAVRWAPAEQLHLTLKFLGDIPAAAVEELAAGMRAVCRSYGPLSLTVEGLGCFPNARSPRVIWIGLHGDLPELERLQGEIEGVCSRWAAKEERRRFSPHLTIGRVRENAWRQARQVGQVLAGAAAPVLGAWTAAEVCLMRSKLSPHGATHVVLAKAPLGGPGVGKLPT